MSLVTYHEYDHRGRHYRFVYDEYHQTRGSYAYATDEETKQAEEEEIEKLNSGEWVALGVIVTRACPSKRHCRACDGHEEIDSLWGIVVENRIDEVERFARERM